MVKPSAITLWKRQLGYQAAASRAADVTFLHNLPAWIKARNVLEVGCGSCHFLENIAEAFPAKRYTAIDKNANILPAAQRRMTKYSSVRVIDADLLRLDGKWKARFDFVIARAVVQHLQSIEAFLRSISEVLLPGGYLFLLDANDSFFKWAPKVRSVETLMKRLAERERSLGVGREALMMVENVLRRSPFRIAQRGDIIISASTPVSRTTFFRLFSNLAALGNAHFGLNLNEAQTRNELRAWKSTPGSYAQFGMRALLLQIKN